MIVGIVVVTGSDGLRKEARYEVRYEVIYYEVCFEVERERWRRCRLLLYLSAAL